MSRHIRIIGFLGITFFLTFLLLWLATSPSSADDLRKQALELRNQARREDCQRVALRISNCYTGDDDACMKMQNSLAWFFNEYGETPELSCPQKELPFG